MIADVGRGAADLDMEMLDIGDHPHRDPRAVRPRNAPPVDDRLIGKQPEWIGVLRHGYLSCAAGGRTSLELSTVRRAAIMRRPAAFIHRRARAAVCGGLRRRCHGGNLPYGNARDTSEKCQ